MAALLCLLPGCGQESHLPADAGPDLPTDGAQVEDRSQEDRQGPPGDLDSSDPDAPDGDGDARDLDDIAPDRLSDDPVDGLGDPPTDPLEDQPPYPPLTRQPVRLCMAAGLPYGGDPDHQAQVDLRLDAYQGAAIRVLRDDFNWQSAEPEAGTYDFSRFDERVDAAAGRGIEFVALVSGSALWANGNQESIYYPPQDPADYGRFLFEMASHFGGRIRHWEIWNEQNAGYRFWLPRDDPEAYGDLLKTAYLRIHEANPEATVSLGGLFDQKLIIPGALEFMQELFEIHPDICQYFDVFAYHPYRYPFTAPEHEDAFQPSQRTSLHRLRSLLAEHGCQDTPVWITEVGWHTALGSPIEGVSLEEQAYYLIRSYVLAFADGVSLVCWYTITDGPDSGTWQEDAFGVFQYDPVPGDLIAPEPKPAYRALQALGAMLDGRTHTGPARSHFGLLEAEYGETFSGEDSSLVSVIWRPRGERSLEVHPEGALFYDWSGQPLSEPVVSPAPVFVVWDQN